MRLGGEGLGSGGLKSACRSCGAFQATVRTSAFTLRREPLGGQGEGDVEQSSEMILL